MSDREKIITCFSFHGDHSEEKEQRGENTLHMVWNKRGLLETKGSTLDCCICSLWRWTKWSVCSFCWFLWDPWYERGKKNDWTSPILPTLEMPWASQRDKSPLLPCPPNLGHFRYCYCYTETRLLGAVIAFTHLLLELFAHPLQGLLLGWYSFAVVIPLPLLFRC